VKSKICEIRTEEISHDDFIAKKICDSFISKEIIRQALVKNFSESIHDICENFNIKIDGRKKIFMKTCSPNEKISTMDASEKRAICYNLKEDGITFSSAAGGQLNDAFCANAYTGKFASYECCKEHLDLDHQVVCTFGETSDQYHKLILSTDAGEEEVVDFSHSNAESCSLTFANTNDESYHVKISGEAELYMLEDSDFTNDKKTAHQKAAPPKFFGVSVELGVFGTETDSSGCSACQKPLNFIVLLLLFKNF